MNQNNTPSHEEQAAILSKLHRDSAIKGDTHALGLLLADDWVVVGPMGTVDNKAQQARKFQEGSMKFEAIEAQNLNVRVHSDTAIVAGLYRTKATVGGQQIDGFFRHTDVFAKQGETWRCVFTQSTRVAAPPALDDLIGSAR